MLTGLLNVNMILSFWCLRLIMVYKKKMTFQADSQTSGKQYMLIRDKA